MLFSAVRLHRSAETRQEHMVPVDFCSCCLPRWVTPHQETWGSGSVAGSETRHQPVLVGIDLPRRIGRSSGGSGSVLTGENRVKPAELEQVGGERRELLAWRKGSVVQDTGMLYIRGCTYIYSPICTRHQPFS